MSMAFKCFIENCDINLLNNKIEDLYGAFVAGCENGLLQAIDVAHKRTVAGECKRGGIVAESIEDETREILRKLYSELDK